MWIRISSPVIKIMFLPVRYWHLYSVTVFSRGLYRDPCSGRAHPGLEGAGRTPQHAGHAGERLHLIFFPVIKILGRVSGKELKFWRSLGPVCAVDGRLPHPHPHPARVPDAQPRQLHCPARALCPVARHSGKCPLLGEGRDSREYRISHQCFGSGSELEKPGSDSVRFLLYSTTVTKIYTKL